MSAAAEEAVPLRLKRGRDDRARERHARFHQPDADCEKRMAMREVHGAVDRVADPGGLVVELAALLLTDDGDFGRELSQAAPDELLAREVVLRHEVGVTRLAANLRVRAVPGENYLSRLAGDGECCG